jgi:hypothetical protein
MNALSISYAQLRFLMHNSWHHKHSSLTMNQNVHLYRPVMWICKILHGCQVVCDLVNLVKLLSVAAEGYFHFPNNTFDN